MSAAGVIDVDEWHARYLRSDLGKLDECMEVVALKRRCGDIVVKALHHVIVPEVGVRVKGAAYRRALEVLRGCEEVLCAVKDVVDATKARRMAGLDEIARGGLTYRALVMECECAVEAELRKCQIRRRFARQLLDDLPPPPPPGPEDYVASMTSAGEGSQPLPPMPPSTTAPTSPFSSLPRLGSQVTPLYTAPIRIPLTPP